MVRFQSMLRKYSALKSEQNSKQFDSSTSSIQSGEQFCYSMTANYHNCSCRIQMYKFDQFANTKLKTIFLATQSMYSTCNFTSQVTDLNFNLNFHTCSYFEFVCNKYKYFINCLLRYRRLPNIHLLLNWFKTQVKQFMFNE